MYKKAPNGTIIHNTAAANSVTGVNPMEAGLKSVGAFGPISWYLEK
jgi:hypothetical protein